MEFLGVLCETILWLGSYMGIACGEGSMIFLDPGMCVLIRNELVRRGNNTKYCNRFETCLIPLLQSKQSKLVFDIYGVRQGKENI